MPGTAALSYAYSKRLAVLEDPPPGEMSPHLYALCSKCADRLRPPIGWELIDRRDAPPLFLPPRGGSAEEPDNRVASGRGA
jgi:hypothetical protein